MGSIRQSSAQRDNLDAEWRLSFIHDQREAVVFTFGICLTSLHFILTRHNLLSEKAKIIIPSPVVRTARRHIFWCSSEGSPPIKVSLFKNSTFLADGIGMVARIIDEEGIYSCLASNVAGTDSKEFKITVVGRSLLFRFLVVVLQTTEVCFFLL